MFHPQFRRRILQVDKARATEDIIQDLLPIAYWPLQETAGTVAADIAGNSPGVYVNTPTLGATPGPIAGDTLGYASFDGSTENITVAGGVLWDSTGPASIVAWVFYEGDFSGGDAFPNIVALKTDQATPFVFNIGDGSSGAGGYRGLIFGSSSNFIRGESPAQASSTFQNNWRLAMLTYDGANRMALGSYTIYVDGIAVEIEAAGLFNPGTNTTKMAFDGTANTRMNGGLNHVAVFAKELTADDARDIFQASL